MSYNLNMNSLTNYFTLPNDIVDKYINISNYNYIKVIMYIYRNANKKIDSKKIAQDLNITLVEVHNSIEYWISHDILPPDFKSNDNDQKVKIRKSDLATIDTNTNDKNLYEFMEHLQYVMSRPLSKTEQQHFYEIITTLNLPTDVVLMAVQYCTGINKPNIQYIKKVCEDWASKNILTHEATEQHISLLMNCNQIESKIKIHFGINNRALSSKEKEFIDKWIKEFNYDTEMIFEAYDKTIDTIGKLSFPYINSILESWRKENIISKSQIKNVKRKNYTTKPKNIKNKNSQNTSYDLGAFDILFDNVPEI